MRHLVYIYVPISRKKDHHLELQVLLIVSWLVTMQMVLQVKKKHRARERASERARERERESMRNGSFALIETMWNGSFALGFWLVRMETGRLKALNSIGAQTLNPNSMPSFGNQTKPFS